MTTVKIDVQKISSAITAMKTLASSIDGQRHRATTGTPVSLPSLDDGKIGVTARWLNDNVDTLTSRRDLAILLDTKGSGHATYTVDADTLTHVENMLGETLASSLKDVDYETSDEDIARLNTILSNWKNNPAVMATTYKALGPDGTVGTIGGLADLMRNAGGDQAEALNTLAANIRSGLATATKSPDFQQVDPATGKSYAETFGENIVKYSVSPLLSDDEREAFEKDFQITAGDGGSILTFLMLDHGYSDDFVLGAADKLDSFEKLAKDSIMPADVWYSHNGYSPLEGNGDGGYADDPMAAIMGNLGAHPAAGLEFFTEDPNRQKFYFDDRTWKADGYQGITEAAEGITTDLDNLKNHPHETTELASTFLHDIADSDGFNAEDAKAASPYLAKLLKFYMPAVDQALRNGSDTGKPADVRFVLDHFGDFAHYPELFKGDLDSLMQVAMGTEDGMQSIAEGVGTFQQTQLNNVAVELGLDPDDPGTRTELRDVLQRTSALSGFTEHSVGQVEIDAAEDRDAQRQAFIDLVSDAAGLVPLPGADVVGELGSKAIDYGWGKAVELGTDAAGEHFASDAEGTTDEADTRAEQGSVRVKINAYVALVDAGVIPRDEVPDMWIKNGSLIDPSGIDPDEASVYAQSAMNGVNNYATNLDLETAYKHSFVDYYKPAGK